MNPLRARSGWASTIGVLSGLKLFNLTGCASLAPDQSEKSDSAATASLASEDDDWSQLKAQMRIDLNRYNSREIARTPLTTPAPASAQSRDREFNQRAQALFAPLS